MKDPKLKFMIVVSLALVVVIMIAAILISLTK